MLHLYKNVHVIMTRTLLNDAMVLEVETIMIQLHVFFKILLSITACMDGCDFTVALATIKVKVLE